MKNKLTKTQEKIIDCYNKSEELYETIKNYLSFDVECPNDNCGGRNGVRQIACAWRTKDNRFNVYCSVCGQETILTNSELKGKKRKFEKEKKEYEDEEFYEEIDHDRDTNK